MIDSVVSDYLNEHKDDVVVKTMSKLVDDLNNRYNSNDYNRCEWLMKIICMQVPDSQYERFDRYFQHLLLNTYAMKILEDIDKCR